MSASWTLYKRELSALFLSPIAYIFAIVTLIALGFSFLLVLSGLIRNSSEFNLQELVDYFFGGFILVWVILFGLVTAITMRLFAEEKRTGTIEALLTTPVTDLQVVTAKFLGALTFYALLWVPTLFFFTSLGDKALDPGILGGAYLGVLLVGAFYIAIGCLISSLCTSQMVAAIVCFLMLNVVTFLPLLLVHSTGIENAWLKESFVYLNIFPAGPHSLISDLNRGLVSVTHLVYPLSATACCLFLTCKVLESRSWK